MTAYTKMEIECSIYEIKWQLHFNKNSTKTRSNREQFTQSGEYNSFIHSTSTFQAAYWILEISQ